MATSWKFKLNVNNHTNREFEVISKNLNWGYWDLNDVEDREPISIKPNTNAQVLGIKAARGTWTGYECDCTWMDQSQSGSYGTIFLKIDVPFSAHNSSNFTLSGRIKASGWENLPNSGHNFTRSIDLYEVDGALVINTDDDKSVDKDELAYKKYKGYSIHVNDTIKNWSELENVALLQDMPILEVIPKEYIYPPNVLLRSEKFTIPKDLWDGFEDPKYDNGYLKEEFLEEYFAVGVYTLNTDTRNVQSVPAGVDTVKESTIEVTSVIKDTLTTSMSISVSLNGSKSQEKSYSLAAELESEFSISDVHEESSSTMRRETTTYTIGASDKNRIFVQWLLMEALAIYRKKKSGEVELLAISEWPLQVFEKVYDY